MMPQPDTAVIIEYDCRGRRIQKLFECPYAARRFYVAKDRAGKRPKVRRPDAADPRKSPTARKEDRP